jgi:sugar lactone lactonase YvrE
LFGMMAMLLLLGHRGLARAEEKEARFVLAWGKKGEKPGEFFSPISIAIDRRDVVYVTDLNNARLQRFTTEGEYLGGFNLPLDSPPRTTCLVGGMAVDDNDNIYLSLMIQDKVQVYSESGLLLREWGKRGAEDGDLRQPGGIVLAPGGTVYVADQGNHRVQIFDEDGNYRGKWGEHGSGPGQFGGNEPKGSRFGGPHFLARDSIGRIYTTEGTLGRVQLFAEDGKPLHVWGDKGDQRGGFGALKTGFSKQTFGPIGVFVDRQDRVWVSSLNDRVQAFTADGKFLIGLGGTGSNAGQFARPHGMAVDSKGHLYVADAGNQRVQKFAIPELRTHRPREAPPLCFAVAKEWDRTRAPHEQLERVALFREEHSDDAWDFSRTTTRPAAPTPRLKVMR